MAKNPANRRGQGGMEYLMSYGWAIAVVAIVGIGLWKMGVINLGITPPTGTGFSQVQPILSTCKMGTNIEYEPGNPTGFGCQFVNNVGNTITVRSVDVSITGKRCYKTALSTVPAKVTTPQNYIETQYAADTSTTGTASGLSSFDVKKDGQLTLSVVSPTSGANSIGPCGSMVTGNRYTVSVDIAYDVQLGPITASKHSIGKIQVTATP